MGFAAALMFDVILGYLLIHFHDQLVRHFGEHNFNLISFGLVVVMIVVILAAIKARKE